MNIKYHYVGEKLEEGFIIISYVPSRLERSDVFTKPKRERRKDVIYELINWTIILFLFAILIPYRELL